MPFAGRVPDFASPFDRDTRAVLDADLASMDPPASRREYREITQPDASLLLDAIAVRCARGRGAVDLLVGAELARMMRFGGENRLGFSIVEDFARERLGLSESLTKKLIRDEEALRFRPLLRAAVWRGEVTRRKAEVVMRRAHGEEEERWVGLARVCTVRELEELVHDPGATPEPDEDGPLRRIRISLDSDSRELVRDGLELAGIIAGTATSTVRRLELMAMEFLAAHAEHAPDPATRSRPSVTSEAPPPSEGERRAPASFFDLPPPGPTVLGEPHHRRFDARATLERETRRWKFLEEPPQVGVGVGDAHEDEPFDPYACQARLKELVADRNAWDHDLGRACLLLNSVGGWREAGFTSFDHYCHERLGMGTSTVKQRIALERKLADLPALREAMRTGRLSYEQARLVARVATPKDVEARVEEAASKTCVALRRSLDPSFQDASPGSAADGEGQMWNELDVVAPLDVATVLGDAFVAARAMAKHWLTPGQALALVAAHFTVTYDEEGHRKVKQAGKAMKRDRFLCQVPGCSLAADDEHHIVFRSRGGSDDPSNLLAVCKPHHLRCIHSGTLLVLGQAPDRLTFVFGEREVAAHGTA